MKEKIVMGENYENELGAVRVLCIDGKQKFYPVVVELPNGCLTVFTEYGDYHHAQEEDSRPHSFDLKKVHEIVVYSNVYPSWVSTSHKVRSTPIDGMLGYFKTTIIGDTAISEFVSCKKETTPVKEKSVTIYNNVYPKVVGTSYSTFEKCKLMRELNYIGYSRTIITGKKAVMEFFEYE